MARRYYHRRKYHRENNDLERFIAGVFALAILGLFSLYISNQALFWRWIIYIVLICIGVVGLMFLCRWLMQRFNQKHLDGLMSKLKQVGQEEYLENFINRFGLEDGKKKGWSYRNHNFDWDRINDLKKILREKNVTSNEKDVFVLLRSYIQEKEENLTRESIHKEPQKFANLTGTDFENLLYRLFEAMGYAVQRTGRTGDQGGDLIANMNGERTIIQAKCYTNAVGNFAVQEAVAAKGFYNCNKIMVATNSSFTREAIELAKANSVELISSEHLQGLLVKYLGESWV